MGDKRRKGKKKKKYKAISRGNRKECPKKIICLVCLKEKEFTMHHIMPKRHFARSSILLLCRDCHDKLEQIIPYGKIKKREYEKKVVSLLLYQWFWEGKAGIDLKDIKYLLGKS